MHILCTLIMSIVHAVCTCVCMYVCIQLPLDSLTFSCILCYMSVIQFVTIVFISCQGASIRGYPGEKGQKGDKGVSCECCVCVCACTCEVRISSHLSQYWRTT